MTVDEFLFIDTTRQKRDEVCFQVYFVIFTRFVSSFALICPNINPIRQNVFYRTAGVRNLYCPMTFQNHPF
jgi:hypothetical protein